MVDGVLYVSTSLSQVAAIDAATGKTKWVYDPETWKNGTPSNNGFVHRGVAYWADGNDRRILFGTGDGYLICLDAQTGKPIARFGQQGRIDLTQGLGRAGRPAPLRRLVAAGHLSRRRRDGLEGARLSRSTRRCRPATCAASTSAPASSCGSSVPSPARASSGNETWEQDSWKTTGGTNVWTLMSADEELGYVYLPFSTPTNDYYGGHAARRQPLRREPRLPGRAHRQARLALPDRAPRPLGLRPARGAQPDRRPRERDARQGRRPGQQAGVRATCSTACTGKPIWPIEERPVPQSTVPGEKSSRDAAVPDAARALRPPGRHRERPDRLHAGAAQGGARRSREVQLRPALHAAVAREADDPDARHRRRRQLVGCGVRSRDRNPVRPVESRSPGASRSRSRRDAARRPTSGVPAHMETLQGVPLWKPPYGRITAIDLNTGDHRWMVPMGDLGRATPAAAARPSAARTFRPRSHAPDEDAADRRAGGHHRSARKAASARGRASTSTTRSSRAYDKATGKVVGEVALPRNATAAPMTYMLNGAQFIVVATGGANLPAELVALRLP